ncbi:MAG TPA: GNAT family N-acetyltransferase [Flavisolibacter sp.]|jgi:ribosomal protein S18 acetylase RimI-like enzyme|nr:GNAT family N-acetyltransferase [Flavisolibacter sp.]
MQVQIVKGVCCIREASASDLSQLVPLHIASFNATYPDYNPKPGYELRERQWKLLFGQKPGTWFCYVVQPPKGPIAGFVTGHDFHDPELPYKGQLDKIHILKPYQRLGLGSQLVLQVVTCFLQQGINSMILFADPSNPAIRFYDGMNGERLLNKDQAFRGAYGWKNLHELATFLRQRNQ